MKEKIAVRLEEVRVLGLLADALDTWERSTRSDLVMYDECLKEQFPDVDYDKDCWNYQQRECCKAKLAAYENVRAMILKAMG